MKYEIKLAWMSILAACFFFSSCKDKAPTDCSMVETGDFSFHSGNDGPSYTIKRTEAHQYERNNENGETIEYRVKWTSPCSYDLVWIQKKPGKSIQQEPDSFLDSVERMTTTISILKLEKKFYLFRAEKEKIGGGFIDTMWIDAIR